MGEGYPLERWQRTIEEGWGGERPLEDASLRGAVEGAVAALDAGDLRVATPPAVAGGEWTTHAWVKEAILLYFRMRVSEPVYAGDLEFFDKVPLKHDLASAVAEGRPTVDEGSHVVGVRGLDPTDAERAAVGREVRAALAVRRHRHPCTREGVGADGHARDSSWVTGRVRTDRSPARRPSMMRRYTPAESRPMASRGDQALPRERSMP